MKLFAFAHSPNTLRKGMNQTILDPAMGKIVERLGFSALVW